MKKTNYYILQKAVLNYLKRRAVIKPSNELKEIIKAANITKVDSNWIIVQHLPEDS